MNNLTQDFIKNHGSLLESMTYRQFQWNDLLLEDQLVYSLIDEGSPVTRDSVKHKVSADYINKQPFDVITAYFPYNDNSNLVDLRPVIVIPYTEDKYIYMMITSGEKTDRVYRLYEVRLDDWKECGLKKFCFARANVIRQEDTLIFTDKCRVIGHLTDKSIIEISKMLERYGKECFTNPIPFLDWLIDHKVSDTIHITGNNNNCPIQTIDDIKKSLHANCIDIAIVTYKMAKNTKIIDDSTISFVKWTISEDNTQGHIFMLFKFNNGTYVFDYDQINIQGSFVKYRGSFENISKWFSSMIRKNAGNEKIRNLPPNKQRVKTLSKKDLETVKDVRKYSTQKEWLKEIGW